MLPDSTRVPSPDLVNPFEPASVLAIVAVAEGWVVIVLFTDAVPDNVIVPLFNVYPVVPNRSPSETFTEPTVTVPAVPWNMAFLAVSQVAPETGDSLADQFVLVAFHVPVPPRLAPFAVQNMEDPT